MTPQDAGPHTTGPRTTAPQDTVERALAAARCDDCVVIADETSSANLRWAANSLTTNGVSRSRQLTVIAITRKGPGACAGVVSRAGVRADQVADVVEAAEQAASESSPAEDAQPLLGPADPEAYRMDGGSAPRRPSWDDAPASTGIDVFAAFSPALGEAFGTAAAAGRKLYGYAEHSLTSTFLGTSTGLRLRHDQPTGKADINAKAGNGASAWLGRATSDFTDVDVAAITAGLGQQLDWARRQVRASKSCRSVCGRSVRRRRSSCQALSKGLTFRLSCSSPVGSIPKPLRWSTC